MTSTTSSKSTFQQFSTVFRWSLRKHLGISALYGLLLFLTLPIWLIFAISNKQIINPDFPEAFLIYFYYPLTLLFTLLFTSLLFGYLHKKRSMDLFHALPIGRNTLLLARYCAGLVLILVPLFLNYLITAMLFYPNVQWNGGMDYRRIFLEQATWFLMLTVLVSFTFCMFISVCCGTTVDSMVSIITINIMYPGLILLTSLVQMALLPGFSLFSWQDLNLLTALCPAGCFISGLLPFMQQELVSWQYHLWWFAFLIVMFAAALLLNKRRKSEMAETSFAFPAPAVIIRAIASFVVGLGFGFLLSTATSGTLALFFVGMVVGSLTAHLILEAIYSRGFRKLAKSLPYYGGVLALLFAFTLVLSSGVFGLANKMPAAAEVESVTLYGYDLTYMNGDRYHYYDGSFSLADTSDTATVRQYLPELSSQEGIERVLRLHRICQENRVKSDPFKNPFGESIVLEYHLKDGSTMRRSYPSFGDTNYWNTLQEISDSEEFIRSSNVIYHIQGSDINLFKISFNGYYPASDTLSEQDNEWIMSQAEMSDTAPRDKSIYTASDQQKQELLEALCADLLAQSSEDNRNWKNNLLKKDFNLWSISLAPYGNDDKGITYANARYFSDCTFEITPGHSHTIAVLLRHGWLTEQEIYPNQSQSDTGS